jgi:hypothetical protein
MQAKGWIMLRVLLNRYHPNFPPSLLQALPQQEIDAVNKLEITSKNPAEAILSPAEELKKIHYSWLTSYLEKIPMQILEPTIHSLSPEQAAKFSVQFEIPPLAKPIAQPIKTYLLLKLFNAVKPPEILPVEFLPQTHLSCLARLSKNQLIELIDYLGIYDLTEEVRHIIEKEKLKKLNVCLDQKQKTFLRICLHQREKVAAPPVNLKQWDGSQATLRKLVHVRGLLRLGKACCGQHPDLMWHISHHLDIGRGKEVIKNFSSAPIPGVTAALIQQVLSVMDFLNLRE